jgi:hypothetical protein
MTMNGYGRFVLEDALEQLASPEIVLPEQLQGQGEKQGEKRLMLAVLAEAVGTFQRHARATSRRGERLFREVDEWINSMDNSWIYSFESICHTLGLDSDNLRAGLRVWESAPCKSRREGVPIPSGERETHVGGCAQSRDRKGSVGRRGKARLLAHHRRELARKGCNAIHVGHSSEKSAATECAAARSRWPRPF